MLKKTLLSIITGCLLLVDWSGSAFAETKLQSMIDPLLGTPYRWGGISPSGFDCSGFIKYIYGELGVKLPHNSAMQAKLGTTVSTNKLMTGDLLFFHTYGVGITHVGIFIGNGKFVDATTHRGIVVNSFDNPYYFNSFVTAKHILSDAVHEKIIQTMQNDTAKLAVTKESAKPAVSTKQVSSDTPQIYKWVTTNKSTNAWKSPSLKASAYFRAKAQTKFPVIDVAINVTGVWDKVLYNDNHTAWIADWVVHTSK